MLYVFVALQSLRTTAAAELVNETTDQFAKVLWRSDAEAHGIDLSTVSVSSESAVIFSLDKLRYVLDVIFDLEMHLVCASWGQTFITSDNPVFRYNLFCEGTVGRGTLGWGQRGFLAFVPLSPTVLLLMYDSGVYKVGVRRASETFLLRDTDVTLLNRMQAVGASQNLYFHDWKAVREIACVMRSVRRLRGEAGSRVLEYLDVTDEQHALVHTFEQMPNLHLQLSFLHLRKDAKQVPFHDRPQQIRKAYLRQADNPAHTEGANEYQHFVRADLYPSKLANRNRIHKL